MRQVLRLRQRRSEQSEAVLGVAKRSPPVRVRRAPGGSALELRRTGQVSTTTVN